ncbi:hypothetical protein PINS_up001313 [Pythium insidiosum]|nr:hypothetical protein PINS_up001313 [Pythium insidiosum]
MWLSLAIALLAVALSSKASDCIAGALVRLLLLAIEKGGLLTNVRLDERTRLTVRIPAIELSVARHLWTFLRAPRHQPLLSIRLPSLSLRIRSSSSARSTLSGDVNVNRSHLDTSISLKLIDHPLWQPIRAWIHRLRWIRYVAHIVCLVIEDIEIEALEASNALVDDVPSFHLQRGFVDVRTHYDTSRSDLDVTVQIAPANRAAICMTANGTMAEAEGIVIRVQVPLAHSNDDRRSILPVALTIAVASIAVSMELDTLLAQHGQPTPTSLDDTQSTLQADQAAPTGGTQAHPIDPLFALRVVEAIPDEISVSVRHAMFRIKDRSAGNTVRAQLNQLGVQGFNPAPARLAGRYTGDVDHANPCAERHHTVELARAQVVFEPSTLTNSETSSATVTGFKLEGETKIVAVLDMVGASECQKPSVCSIRVGGECKGVSIRITDDLQSWLVPIFEAASHTEKNELDNDVGVISDAEIEDNLSLEQQVQFKILHIELDVTSRTGTCAVLPNGVPSVQLSVDELIIIAYPNISSEPLGVRARTTIQCSRVKLLHVSRDRLTRAPFVSLDCIRVFIDPVSLMTSNESPAEVEMEAEWLELKWSPEAMHAIGGMMELGIYLTAPLLREQDDWEDDDQWATDAPHHIPKMKSIQHVTEDILDINEWIKFRCTIKRSLALFSFMNGDHEEMEYITVNKILMSVEGQSKRFRIAVLDTKVFHLECKNSIGSPQSVRGRLASLQWWAQSSMSRTRSQSFARPRHRPSRVSLQDGREDSKSDLHYFSVGTFSLEEIKLPRCPKTVVDMYADKVDCRWDIASQQRVLEVVRQITFSSWEMLYRMRSAYGTHCTNSSSRFNRPSGINAPHNDLSECQRQESLLRKLVSASGDKLHRIRATNIIFDAKIEGHHDICLRLGLLGGDDLPDLWSFKDIAFTSNQLELIKVEQVNVRHTVAKRRDYVFGEFEELLDLRRKGCGMLAPDGIRRDGMMIDIEGLHIGLSVNYDLVEVANSVAASIAPYGKLIQRTFSMPWRPQNDLFYRFFLRVPQTPGSLHVWLTLANLKFECADNEMECWLQRVYPLWLHELQERELRAQVLDEQITSLKLTNVDLLHDAVSDDMMTLLLEKNSKVYYQKFRNLRARVGHSCADTRQGSIVVVKIGILKADIIFEASRRRMLERMRDLDEAAESVDKVLRSLGVKPELCEPKLALLIQQSVDVVIEDFGVYMRNFPTPILLVNQIKCCGDVIVAAPACIDNVPFPLTMNLRGFADIQVHIIKPTAFFCPGYVHTLEELGAFVEKLIPSLFLDVDKAHGTMPWDIFRRIIHGRAQLNVVEAAVKLGSSSSAFDFADYLEVGAQAVVIDYANSGTDVRVDRLTAKIEPDGLSSIAEFASITLRKTVEWTTLGNPSIHYVYPVIFCLTRDGFPAEEVCIDLQRRCYVVDGNWLSSGSPLTLYEASGLDVKLQGRISPASCAQSTSDGGFKRGIASRAAIILYSKHVEWLIRFGRLYGAIPQLPRVQRKKSGLEVSCTGIDENGKVARLVSPLAIVSSIVVKEFEVVGLDFALYNSEKSPIGLRACINDKISVAGSCSGPAHKKTGDEGPSRRLPLTIDGYQWSIDDITLVAHDVQLRICTLMTGSRGESLFAVRDVCLNLGGATDRIVAHFECVRDAVSKRNSLRGMPTDQDEKRNILEHFAISQHNPYRFRDTDETPVKRESGHESTSRNLQLAFFDEVLRKGCTLGIAATEIRVLITLETVEAIVDIVESWTHLFHACLSDVDTLPDTIAMPVQAVSDPITQDNGGSKKATSLAEDPKFGAIFRAASPLNGRYTSFESDSNRDDNCPGESKSTVHPFIMVRLMDCQISFHDHEHKGSVLLALKCLSLSDSFSQANKQECIEVNVEDLQVFTAPLDIDVKSRVIWLKTNQDGSFSPGAFGLLKQVVATVPADVKIWITRDTIVTNTVDIQIPSVEVSVNTDSKEILQHLITSIITIVKAKLSEYQTLDYSKMLRGSHQHPSVGSLEQLHHMRRQLRWQITQLRWRQTCRLNYFMTERASATLAAVEGGHSSTFDYETSPLFCPRRLSSASLSSGLSLALTGSTQVETTDDIQRLQTQYESITEVLRSLIRAQLKRRQPNPNVQLDFNLHKASLTLSSSSADIMRAEMKHLRAKLKMFEDKSGSTSLTIQDVSCLNLCPGTPYPELLLPTLNSKSWSGGEMFLRVDTEVSAPVGGITVVQHFEVNVHPMQVCLTQELILQLVAFASSHVASAKQEERKAEIRSQFLTAPQTGPAVSDRGLLKKAARVAGRAAHPLGFGGRHRNTDNDPATVSRMRAIQTLHEEATTWIARIAHPDMDSSMHQSETDAGADGASGPSEARDVLEMRDRAKNNILFKRIRLGTVEVAVTYKNKKAPHNQPPHALEDMRGFEIKIHSLVYCDKTCSLSDLMLRVRRDIILDVLSQVGRNFTNIATFLRDQFDISRWAPFDALAPLMNLSTSITSAPAPPASPASTDHAAARHVQPTKADAIPTSPRDAAKVFQLELPESHPSLRKKHPSPVLPGLRSAETTLAKPGVDAPSSPTAAQHDDGEDASAPHAGQHKSKKSLSSFFGRSKKSTPPTPTNDAGATPSKSTAL